MDKNDIGELVEEHNQELIIEELMEFRCVSQQPVVEESLSEEEEVTAKQQSSNAVREMKKAWETLASFIGKNYPNKAVALCPLEIYFMIMLRRIFVKFSSVGRTNVSRQIPTRCVS
ncbi:hypothetical protein AVEN_268737-1 [Araneus ventricosus]|uniref:Uncharacterized protein n=1 Tax=Araneus ventricosus TaxID=182803 RepID=A0A4Y2H3P0_ARAVE|nr:hypothetical protein AVEN_268737-1 [Araneus ventricosus]